MHKFDTICIFKSYLNPGMSSSIDKLDIFGYNMSRADHPSGNWRWGVFIYYKASLPIKMLNIDYIQECISFDLKIERKHCTILSLYRSSSWSANKIEIFLNKLNLILESIIQNNLFLTVAIGDFNAVSSTCWTDDQTTQEGLKIENLLSQFSFSQVVNNPTHIFQNFNSCIDLLFTNQQNLITDLGVHLSIHSNCHYQIIYGKFNFKIFYPPQYGRHIWH